MLADFIERLRGTVPRLEALVVDVNDADAHRHRAGDVLAGLAAAAGEEDAGGLLDPLQTIPPAPLPPSAASSRPITSNTQSNTRSVSDRCGGRNSARDRTSRTTSRTCSGSRTGTRSSPRPWASASSSSTLAKFRHSKK